jgi:hypothetical protein
VPKRIGGRIDRSAGPAPFSKEWNAAPDKTPVTRSVVQLPEWLPDERTLSAALVLLLSLAIAVVAAGARGVPPGPGDPGRLVASSAAATPDATPSAQMIAASPPAEPATPTALAGALLPANRILAYYGHPHDKNMGIVGEHAIEETFDLLLREKANYEAADPSRPVIPAFELIATVAQRDPGADGTYLLDTDTRSLERYADFAEARGAIVILDLQIGRSTVPAEFEKVRKLLERPHVHLALDPEFAMAEGQTPGLQIGSLPASSVAWAQRELALMVEELGLPPKLLIVHQFEERMIRDKMSLRPRPGVQLVIDADGYGVPAIKIAVFNFLVRDEPIEFAGVKLFYRQDDPLMTPEDVLALEPSPDVIIYQ